MPRGPKRLRTPDGKLSAIGERLQQLRVEKNLTQEELAARIGVIANWTPLRESLNQMLRGERIIGDLEVCVIADAIECNPVWLMFGYGDPWGRPDGFDYRPYEVVPAKSGYERQ